MNPGKGLFKEALTAYLEETPLPRELSDAAFLVKTGWTWEAYLATPDDVVRGMIVLINAEAEATRIHMEQAKR